MDWSLKLNFQKVKLQRRLDRRVPPSPSLHNFQCTRCWGYIGIALKVSNRSSRASLKTIPSFWLPFWLLLPFSLHFLFRSIFVTSLPTSIFNSPCCRQWAWYDLLLSQFLLFSHLQITTIRMFDKQELLITQEGCLLFTWQFLFARRWTGKVKSRRF